MTGSRCISMKDHCKRRSTYCHCASCSSLASPPLSVACDCLLPLFASFFNFLLSSLLSVIAFSPLFHLSLPRSLRASLRLFCSSAPPLSRYRRFRDRFLCMPRDRSQRITLRDRLLLESSCCFSVRVRFKFCMLGPRQFSPIRSIFLASISNSLPRAISIDREQLFREKKLKCSVLARDCCVKTIDPNNDGGLTMQSEHKRADAALAASADERRGCWRQHAQQASAPLASTRPSTVAPVD